MEGKFENVIIGLVVIGLATFLAISFSIGLATEYGKDLGAYNENSIDLNGLNSSLSQLQEKGEGYLAIAKQRGVFLAFAGFVVVGFFDIGISMLSFVKDFYDIIFIQIFNNIFKVPPVVTGAVLFILIISMIIGLWRILKQGE